MKAAQLDHVILFARHLVGRAWSIIGDGDDETDDQLFTYGHSKSQEHLPC